MKTIRVLHLTSKTFGGIETYVFNCYRYINRERFLFDFLTQNRGLKDAEQYRDLPYQVHQLETTAAQDRNRFTRQIREILVNGRYDILHLHTSYWTGFLIEEIAREIGIPRVIVHSHNSSLEENDDRKRPLLLQRHEELKNVFSPELATDFWACSRAAADWLFGPQIPREKIRIMKNGIETERYRFDQQKRESIRRALGLEDEIVLGTVGRMSYQKNHEFLIDAFEEFHRKCKKSKLMILGDGERREQIERQIQEKHLEGEVLLLGWKTDVVSYLQAMDCFLFPSRFEGLGIAVLEAAASGLPCVVSEDLPEELSFTNRIQRAPLDIMRWSFAAEEALQKPWDRENGWSEVRAAGYDVRVQAKDLEEQYKIR